MMISPETYVNMLQDKPYPFLIRERDELIRFIQDYEKKEMAGDRSDPSWKVCPKPDVKYPVYFDYLALLCEFMRKTYNTEYVFGDHSLKEDSE